jgi:hypothetical protein
MLSVAGVLTIPLLIGFALGFGAREDDFSSAS